MVRFVTNRVDLRTESLARERRILIEQGLNFVVVLLKQRPYLFPLLRGKFEILCETIELLVDRPWPVDPLEFLPRCLRPQRIIPGHGNAGDAEREHAIECEGQ